MNKWTERFLSMAELVASWSKDPSMQVGAVIVRPDKTVASVGFNGFPRGMKDDKELYEDREKKYPRVIHAEVNAILNAHEPVTGMTLYVTHPPCSSCGILVIQSGIGKVVYPKPNEDMLSRWKDSIELSKGFFREAGVEVFEA